jgi:RecJ-like exonuclease
MGIFFIPDLSSSPAPIPLEPKLPELCKTLCQACEGTGYQATADLQDAWRCSTCDGFGALAVCSICGEVPASDTDACACNTCELCSEVGVLNEANICLSCDKKGIEHLECERAKYASDLEEEIAWARSVGWL